MRTIIVASLLLLATIAAVPVSSAGISPHIDECVGKPGQVQACAQSDPASTCAGVGFGLQGVVVCKYPDGVDYCVGFNCDRITIR